MKATENSQFLNPATLANIKDLELLAKTVINGYFTGLHRSNFKGTGIEFVQYRNYTQGDDFKYVDWKTTAKTDKFFIKVFEEETNMDCQLILDFSSSMNYDNAESLQQFGAVSKILYTKMIAACIAYLAHKQNDRMGLTIYTDRVEQHLPSAKTREHLNTIYQILTTTTPSGAGIQKPIVRFISENMNNRGVVFLISDCLSNEDQILQMLFNLRFRHYDCILIHLLHYDEIHFPFRKSHLFIDAETKQNITTNPENIRTEYRENIQQFCENLKNKCFEKEIEYLQITTEQPLDKILTRYLMETRKLNR